MAFSPLRKQRISMRPSAIRGRRADQMGRQAPPGTRPRAP